MNRQFFLHISGKRPQEETARQAVPHADTMGGRLKPTLKHKGSKMSVKHVCATLFYYLCPDKSLMHA